MSGFYKKAVVWLGLNEEYHDDVVVDDEAWESEMDDVARERPTPQPSVSVQERAEALQDARAESSDPLKPAPLNPSRESTSVRAVPMGETSSVSSSGRASVSASGRSTTYAPSGPSGSVGGSGTVRAIPMAAVSKPEVVIPASFNNAQDVADVYKQPKPVIVDLSGAERDLARRLIDFSAGLCYGLGGKMEKLTTDVYLLVPDGVDVSDSDLDDWS